MGSPLSPVEAAATRWKSNTKKKKKKRKRVGNLWQQAGKDTLREIKADKVNRCCCSRTPPLRRAG